MDESSTSNQLRISRVWHRTKAEGPGLRSAIWVQGCSIRCPGCINPHLWSSSGGTAVDPEELGNEVDAAGVEGVTLLGGEPFDQALACAILAEDLKRRGLGVIIFTGYTHDTLTMGTGEGWSRLLAATDLLVDGRFEASDPEIARAWVGSSNQRFIHLTDRYAGLQPAAHANRLELRVLPSGEIDVCGFATKEALVDLGVALDAPVSEADTRHAASDSQQRSGTCPAVLLTKVGRF